jgi:hypothetical protein
MAVNTIAAFQTAIAALTPVSKNTYSLTYLPVNADGSYNCTLLKNGVAFLSNLVYKGEQSSVSSDDANPGGFAVTFNTPDGVRGYADCVLFLATLQ